MRCLSPVWELPSEAPTFCAALCHYRRPSWNAAAWFKPRLSHDSAHYSQSRKPAQPKKHIPRRVCFTLRKRRSELSGGGKMKTERVMQCDVLITVGGNWEAEKGPGPASHPPSMSRSLSLCKHCYCTTWILIQLHLQSERILTDGRSVLTRLRIVVPVSCITESLFWLTLSLNLTSREGRTKLVNDFISFFLFLPPLMEIRISVLLHFSRQ